MTCLACMQVLTTARLALLPIEGASTDEYVPNADDVNTVLRLECTPPYGGAKLVIDTDEIAVDPSTHQVRTP